MSRSMSIGTMMALAVSFGAVPAGMAQRPEGLDVSHWDGDISAASWNTLYTNGYVFCWAKATESIDFTDDTLHTNMARGVAAGVYMGVYHFARPTWNTATAEAQYFVNVAGQYMTGGYMRPVLDLEDGSSLGATALSTWANTFMNQVELLTGVEPLVYTNTNYATYYLNSTMADRTLWIAQYYTNPNPQTQNPSIGIFNSWAFWQWSDHGLPPGLTGSTDMDVHNGTTATLPTYLISGTTQPPYVVESRSGGLHYSNYAETGTWSSGSTKSTAAGTTSGIGSRWCTLDGSAKTAVFSFTPTTSGTYTVYTTNCTTTNSGNPLIHRVSHAGGTSSVGVCQNTTCGSNAVNVWYSLGQYTLNASVPYSVTLDGSTGGGSGPAGNAGRSDAIKWVYTGASGPTITLQPQPATACTGGSAAFSVSATGSGTLSYQWQKNQANLSNGGHYSGVTNATMSISSADANDAANYRCVVTDSNGSSTSNEAALTVISSTTITQQPTAQNVCTGSSAGFTVTASGVALTYQWQKNSVNLNNGGHYSGVTTAALTVSPADSSDAANYRCVVSGSCGTATSNQASLTIKAATSITGQPANQSVASGGTANFSVTATGNGTLTYQWQKNSVNLSNGGHYSGVTTATLTISTANSSDAASYRCVVTGGCGSATSNSATLTVTGGAVTLISDTFDGYAAQANFTAAWPISLSPGGTLSTSAAYSAPKSIYFSTAAARNYRNFTATTASDATPIVFSIRIYDNNTTNLDRQWCELLDAAPSITQLIAIGKSNTLSTMRTYYAARVAYAPGAGWIALNGTGAPVRSVGWHEIKAVIKSTTIDFYVDGVLAKSAVAYAASQGQFSFDQARLGSGYTSTSVAYFDNYVVQSGQ